MAYVAKAWNIPFYVASESFKFTRIFPLDQGDFKKVVLTTREVMKHAGSGASDISDASPKLSVLVPESDFTPPNLITLMFTDLGVLTPSAVSDELIKMYQ